MKLQFNPFNDAGITNYEQYKQYPFLIFGTLESITNRINQQIKQIKSDYYFSERMIILGERGIGKSSALFFIKDILNDSGIRAEVLSRLPETPLQLIEIIKKLKYKNIVEIDDETFAELTSKPIYLLFDFPDAVDTKQFKKFLEFVWSLMTHENYNKINLIFSMNKSHYDKAFSYSETLGKFLNLNLNRLSFDECEKLIDSRLKIVDLKVRDIFSVEVQEIIYGYSKGIPRNIISACSLLIDNSNGNPSIDLEFAKNLLNEKYFEQVINDRVEDLELKEIYKKMISILEIDFKGMSTSQEDYVKSVMEKTGIGRNSVLARILDLSRFGLFNLSRGGYNRVNKIISLN